MLIGKTGPKTDRTTFGRWPCSVQAQDLKVLRSSCNTLALTLPTAATKGLRKWTFLGLEARKGRKWKQRPLVGKGKERRKGRSWGAAPISSAPDRSRRPGGFLQGTSRGRCSRVALKTLRGKRRARRPPSAGQPTPLPQPAPQPAPKGSCQARTLSPGTRPAPPQPSATPKPHLIQPRPPLRLLPGPDPSSPQPICH